MENIAELDEQKETRNQFFVALDSLCIIPLAKTNLYLKEKNEMEWLNELKEVVAWALPWLVGGGAVYVINWLKTTLNIPDKPWLLGWNARAWLTLAVSLVLAAGSHFVEGAFDPGNLTVGNLAETLIAVITTSSTLYFKFIREPEEE